MGVDYGANVGYGFKITYEEAQAASVRLGYEFDDEWFDLHEFAEHVIGDSGIVYDVVGNLMVERGIITFEAPDCGVAIDFTYRYFTDFKHLDVTIIPERILIKLAALFKEIHGKDPREGDIGWFASMTVS